MASRVDLAEVHRLLRSVTFLLFASVVHDSMPIDLLTFGRGVFGWGLASFSSGWGHARLRRGLTRLIHGLALVRLLVWFRSHSVVYNSIYVSFQVDLKATVCDCSLKMSSLENEMFDSLFFTENYFYNPFFSPLSITKKALMGFWGFGVLGLWQWLWL